MVSCEALGAGAGQYRGELGIDVCLVDEQYDAEPVIRFDLHRLKSHAVIDDPLGGIDRPAGEARDIGQRIARLHYDDAPELFERRVFAILLAAQPEQGFKGLVQGRVQNALKGVVVFDNDHKGGAFLGIKKAPGVHRGRFVGFAGKCVQERPHLASSRTSVLFTCWLRSLGYVRGNREGKK